MTQVAVLDIAIFDAPDIEKEGTFYAELTGWDVVRQDADRLGLRAPNGQEIEFQRAPDHLAPQWPGQERPQQFHLDLQVTDPAAQAERAIGLGATHLRDGATWITMADPAGHPFDLCQKDGVGSVMDYDGPEGAMLAGDGRYVMFQQIGDDYRPPRWPDPAYPQQAHLDLLVRDMDAAETQAVTLGASRLDGGGERFRVLADPAGHPFCFVN